MLTARIVVGLQAAKAYCPFNLREIVKSFPGKRWDPVGKHWSIPLEFVQPLAEALRAAGCEVFITRPDGTPWASGSTSHGTRATPAADWADSLFAAVGPDRAEAAFKALAKALHPDVGGDNTLMQQLIAGRERAAFQRRSAS